MMGADGGQRVAVLGEPVPHAVDIFDAEITGEDE